MDLQTYILANRQFMTYLKESGYDVSLPARFDKFMEEVGELARAEGVEDTIKECADCINVLASIMDMLGCQNILWAAYLKLEATKEKYETQMQEKKPFKSCRDLAIKYYGQKEDLP